MILKNLSHGNKTIIRKIASAANCLGLNIYLAGGSVRDMLLDRINNDLDIVVEGNGLEFAKFIFPCLGGEMKAFPAFMSATITTNNQLVVDINTAREEIYTAPGRLPYIKASSIEEDLKRRDFTINSMAVPLNKPEETVLIDPFNGKNDLENKILRVLKKNSFHEDPTRILRAARYASRFRLKLEHMTIKQLYKSVKHLANVSPSRLKNEFIKITEEDCFYRVIKCLSSFNALQYFLPGLDSVTKIKQRHINYVKSVINNENQRQLWLVLLMVLYWEGSRDVNFLLNSRLEFNKKEMVSLSWLIDNSNKIKSTFFSQENISMLELHNLLFNTPREVEVFLLSILDKDREKYFFNIRKAREGLNIPLNGRDLIMQGFKTGPIIGKILTLLKLEVLKGNIKNREDAFCWLNGMRDKYVK